MSDTYVTLQGWAGSDVTHRTPNGVSVASLRVAVTPRVKRNGSWQDGETTWYSVTAWRTLADHVLSSVRKGDAVIVHGRLRTQTWEREGQGPSVTLTVDASLVGHDLNRGTATFSRARRAERSDAVADVSVGETVAQAADETPQLDGWGDRRGPDASAA